MPALPVSGAARARRRADLRRGRHHRGGNGRRRQRAGRGSPEGLARRGKSAQRADLPARRASWRDADDHVSTRPRLPGLLIACAHYRPRPLRGAGLTARSRPRLMPALAEIGVFGGSGFYEWFAGAEPVTVETPYGPASAPISVADVGGRRVAFLPRHGPKHTIPAPFVNYRANVWAMRELGVRRIIGPSAVGSLQPELHPGDLVICDQFIDRTTGRSDTYYPGPEVVHISAADPYCPELRALAGRVAGEQSLRFRPTGTVVVVQGPRFSTRAESRWYSRMGWDIVGMTQYPEVILARELEMCYLNLSLVTDYDAGAEGAPEVAAVQAQDVMRVLAANIARVRDLLGMLIPMILATPSCDCQRSLEGARM